MNQYKSTNRKGLKMVVANGKVISIFTLNGLKNEGLTGFAWKFKKHSHRV